MSAISNQAQGRWESILVGLGIDQKYLNGKHHDCPVCCGGKDRFRFTNLNSKGGYICSQCGSGDGFELLMKVNGWDFKTAAKEVERYLPNAIEVKQKPKKDPLILLKRIAKNSHTGLEVAGYLKGRGLQPNDALKQCKLDYFVEGIKLGTFESMIGLIVDKDNQPVSYHVTYLQNRKKADVPSQKKIMPGVKTITGCAVRFGDGEKIAITEGIETALAVQEISRLPVYAALNANNLEKLELPEHIKSVIIYSDNDSNYTGQKAAFTLANRLELKGVKVRVRIPKNVGEDFLDELIHWKTEQLKQG